MIFRMKDRLQITLEIIQVLYVNVNTMRYGVDTSHRLGPKIWNLLPLSIKTARDLNEFKNLIKSWTPETCRCKLCKTCGRTGVFIGTYHYRDKSSIFLLQYCVICVTCACKCRCNMYLCARASVGAVVFMFACMCRCSCVHVSVDVIYYFTLIFYI